MAGRQPGAATLKRSKSAADPIVLSRAEDIAKVIGRRAVLATLPRSTSPARGRVAAVRPVYALQQRLGHDSLTTESIGSTSLACNSR